MPLAFQGETDGPGDDIRIELLGTPTLVEAQSKHGLTRGRRFDETFSRIAATLPNHQGMLVILAVDQSASEVIKNDLRIDLQRIAQGRQDVMHTITENVRELVKDAGGDALLARITVVEVNLDFLSSSHSQTALITLRQILDNPTQAETAWDIINRQCHCICRIKGRQDYNSLASLLSRRGIKLRPKTEAAAGTALTNIETADTPSPTLPATKSAEETRVALILDSTKQLLDNGQDAAALALLEHIEPDVGRMTISPQTRASLYGRLGATLMRLGRWPEARDYLARALEYEPTHFGSLLNLGIVEISLGHDEPALSYIDRALKEQPSSALAWASRADIATRTGIENSPLGETAADPEYLSALANTAMRRGDWTAARQLAQDAIRKGPRDVNPLMIYAGATFNEAFDTRIERGPLTPEREEILKDVDRITTEVIDSLDKRDQRHKLVDALTLRGATRRALGKVGAEDDLLRATRIDGGSPDAAYQLAILRLQNGDAPGAIVATEMSSTEGSRGARVLLMRARALLALGRTGEIEAVLSKALEGATGSVFELEIRLSGSDVAIDSGLLALAEQLLSGVTGVGEQWLVHLWRARIAVRSDRAEDAEHEYRQAIDLAKTDADSSSANAEFAVYLSRRGSQEEALRYFQQAGADSDSAPEQWRAYYARALYEADELARVDALLRALQSAGPLPYWALEIEARIARRQADASREANALERMLSLKPGGLLPTILLADAHIRDGKADRAHPLIDALCARTDLTAVQRLNVAELALRAGNDTLALPLAFDALHADPDEPNVHLAYVNIFLQTEARGVDFDEQVVKSNTVVTLERTSRGINESLTYIILARGDADTLHDEYLVTDTRVADLLGLRSGDNVVRRLGQLSETAYRISEIKSIFVYAFQDVLKHFARRFPASTALQAFTVGDVSDPGELAFLVQSTSGQSDRIVQILALHTTQLLPIGAVARLTDTDVPRVMRALGTSSEYRLNVERGGQSQYEASVTVAADDGPVVVSRSALVTAHALNLLPLLKQRYPDLLAPTILVAEIESELAELNRGMQGGLHRIGSTPGQGLVVHETSPEEVRREHQKLDYLLRWIHKNCQITPRPLSSFGSERERLREILGSSDFDTCAIAADRGVRLYADDLGLRSLAETEYGVDGFSTWAMVNSQMRGRLSNAERDDLVSQLIDAGHYFVPVNAGLLYH